MRLKGEMTMTIGELIKDLEKYPKNAEIYFSTYDETYNNAEVCCDATKSEIERGCEIRPYIFLTKD